MLDNFFETAKLLITCGTLLLLAFLVLLGLPQSRLRNFLIQIVGYAVTVFCGIYVVSPIDVIPDFIPVAGWLDDGGAVIGGITSAIAAYRAGQER